MLIIKSKHDNDDMLLYFLDLSIIYWTLLGKGYLITIVVLALLCLVSIFFFIFMVNVYYILVFMVWCIFAYLISKAIDCYFSTQIAVDAYTVFKDRILENKPIYYAGLVSVSKALPIKHKYFWELAVKLYERRYENV